MWQHVCNCCSVRAPAGAQHQGESLCKPPLTDVPLYLPVTTIDCHKTSFQREWVVGIDWITPSYFIYLDENMSSWHKAAFATTGVSVVAVDIPSAELSDTCGAGGCLSPQGSSPPALPCDPAAACSAGLRAVPGPMLASLLYKRSHIKSTWRSV